MKRASSILVVLLLVLSGLALGQINGNLSNPETGAVPQLLVHARYVYVRAMDGSQFNPNLLPQDRQAIVDVQGSLQKWGFWAVTYDPQYADVIVVVQRRGSEDYLAVYDAKVLNGTPLWWASDKGGLDPGELPLVGKLEKLVDRAAARSKKGS